MRPPQGQYGWAAYDQWPGGGACAAVMTDIESECDSLNETIQAGGDEFHHAGVPDTHFAGYS